MTHEELLNGYVQARLTVIAERSGDIERDARRVRDIARTYAEEYGIPLDESAFDAYIVEDSWTP